MMLCGPRRTWPEGGGRPIADIAAAVVADLLALRPHIVVVPVGYSMYTHTEGGAICCCRVVTLHPLPWGTLYY